MLQDFVILTILIIKFNNKLIIVIIIIISQYKYFNIKNLIFDKKNPLIVLNSKKKTFFVDNDLYYSCY